YGRVSIPVGRKLSIAQALMAAHVDKSNFVEHYMRQDFPLAATVPHDPVANLDNLFLKTGDILICSATRLEPQNKDWLISIEFVETPPARGLSLIFWRFHTNYIFAEPI